MAQTAEYQKGLQLLEIADDKYKLRRVHIYKTPSSTFVKLTAEEPQNYKKRLGSSLVACLNGEKYSPLIASHLAHHGYKLAEEKPSGHTISKLEDDIKNGRLSEYGNIIPRGVKRPMDTLFLCLDLENNEDIGQSGLISLVPTLIILQSQFPTKDLVLDIVIIDTSDS